MAGYEAIAKDVISQLKESNVEAVFGKPREIQDQTVIPVAKLAYGWGGGGGSGHSDQPEQEDEGGGIGMGVNVKPIGYIDVTREGASYRPIIDFTPLAMIGAGVLGLIALRLAKGFRPGDRSRGRGKLI